MIRPVNFGFNAQTAVNNAFQSRTGDNPQEKALAEFNGFVSLLRANGVEVTVMDDTPEPYTPDSIFPNNWISFHSDGSICLYPMYAPNRRQERKPALIEELTQRFHINNTIDLSHYEAEDRFLEGTGSMVLDRDYHIAYACLSPRTDNKVLDDFSRQMRYKPILFTAVDAKNQPIYHTNVMMCVADKYVVICLDSIPDPKERQLVSDTIRKSKKDLIPISLEQIGRFAGNMLQVHNNKGEKLLVMSSQAFKSLSPEQIRILGKYNRIIHAPLDTIETNGGGSARCMLAEIHDSKKR